MSLNKFFLPLLKSVKFSFSTNSLSLSCRRNDFISVVRSAARTALELMGTESAKQVLNVTKILEDEIKALEGEHAIV